MNRIVSGMMHMLLLTGMLMLAFSIQPIRAIGPIHDAPTESSTSSDVVLAIVNPGPDGYPSKWNASTNVRDLGTGNFMFYSNETDVNDTFFMNVTVQNVTAMKSWGIGIIYRNDILAYMSAWRPTDHVFKPPQDMGWSIIAPPVTFEGVNATHRLLMWGCTYIMPEGEEWTFNGTGQLGQIQFKIIKEVNETYRNASAWFTFDPDWTTIYQHPSGQITPQMKPGYFEYTFPTTVSIINPGPDGYPSRWNASTTNRGFGTPNFMFYSNETDVESTFFMNVTVRDVARMMGWGVGIIYNNETLAYVSAWRPSDHVFSVPEFEYPGPWTIIAPAVSFEDVNATHKLLKWGCTYIMPEGEEWTFNGSGQLAQIQFKIIKEVNETYRNTSAWFTFDSIWTFISTYETPGGFSPPTEPGYFRYEWAPKAHDIVLTSVTPSRTVVGQGFNVSLNVTLANQGSYTETFNITVYANTTIITTIMNMTLARGNSATIIFAWNTSGFAKTNYTVWSYAWPVLGETETTNNNCTFNGFVLVTIPGDVDGNFKVDMGDIIAICDAFGSTPGKPKWNPNCDINNDDKISMDDILIAVEHFGQHYP